MFLCLSFASLCEPRCPPCPLCIFSFFLCDPLCPLWFAVVVCLFHQRLSAFISGKLFLRPFHRRFFSSTPQIFTIISTCGGISRCASPSAMVCCRHCSRLARSSGHGIPSRSSTSFIHCPCRGHNPSSFASAPHT